MVGWERVGRLLCCLCFLTAGCSADTAYVEFDRLQRAPSPNDALACPVNLCQAPADFVTQPVEMTADQLAVRVADMLPLEVRTERVARDESGYRFVFVQRSRLFRFPDTVNILVVPVGETQSTLAIYSRSNYGYGDLGVNRARITAWLAKLGIPYRVGS